MPNRPLLPPRTLIVLFLLCLMVTFACLAYPLYVIRPFRAQGTRELSASLTVLQVRNLVTDICFAISLFALVAWWRQGKHRGLLGRASASAATLATLAFALLCRVNIYERMFHPNTRPAFTEALHSTLDAREKVIVVRLDTVARAYPIRSISYHHVINDVVNGVPIVATY